MSVAPNAQPAVTALHELREQVGRAVERRLVGPPDYTSALRLVVAAHDLWLLGLWLRDASVALARSADPQVGWPEMADAVDVVDSTMYSRMKTWRHTEFPGEVFE